MLAVCCFPLLLLRLFCTSFTWLERSITQPNVFANLSFQLSKRDYSLKLEEEPDTDFKEWVAMNTRECPKCSLLVSAVCSGRMPRHRLLVVRQPVP